MFQKYGLYLASHLSRPALVQLHLTAPPRFERGLMWEVDHIRRRGVICRTRQVEDDVRKDIEEKYGKITIPERELRKILRREKIHAQKKERARKTLMKAFQQRG